MKASTLARLAVFAVLASAIAGCSQGAMGGAAMTPVSSSLNPAGSSRSTSALVSLPTSAPTSPPNKMPDSPALATTSAMTYGPKCATVPVVSAGGYSSCNIQWLAHISLRGGETIGGHYVAANKTYYVTNWESGEYAFNASDPEHPVLAGNLAVPIGNLPAGALISAVENEDTATNGKIVILSRTEMNDAVVLDVHDPAHMAVLSTVPNGPGHTQNCLDNCTWDYGSSTGTIIDLRDPSNPVLETNKWSDVTNGVMAHDLTEIHPGLVATASDPVSFLDTTDPGHPKLLFSLPQTAVEPTPTEVGPAQSGHIGHSVAWPREGKDRYFLGQSEGIYMGRCERFPNDGRTLYSYDTTGWHSAKNFKMAGAYTLVMGSAATGTGGIEGVDANGNPSTAVVGAPEGCSSHWFDVHRNFQNGGLVALSAFAFGVRLLNVASNGQVQQIGWFVPSGLADTVGVHWISDRVMYVLDFETGAMDVIKYTGPLPAAGPLAVARPRT
jgi:hypothetical protein